MGETQLIGRETMPVNENSNKASSMSHKICKMNKARNKIQPDFKLVHPMVLSNGKSLQKISAATIVGIDTICVTHTKHAPNSTSR